MLQPVQRKRGKLSFVRSRRRSETIDLRSWAVARRAKRRRLLRPF